MATDRHLSNGDNWTDYYRDATSRSPVCATSMIFLAMISVTGSARSAARQESRGSAPVTESKALKNRE
jgi:hypothetical protein